MGNLFRRVVTLGAAALLGCGGLPGTALELPALSGGDRVELPWSPTPSTLAERASAERVRNNLAAAERFVRWALKLAPEHPGALLEAARVATARANLSAGRQRARELETARRLYDLAAMVLGDRFNALENERHEALLLLAEAEHGLGRIEQTSMLLTLLDREGRASRTRRTALHEALADTFLARGAPLAGQFHTEAAARLGAGADTTRLRNQIVDLLKARDDAAAGEARLRVESALGSDARAYARLASILTQADAPHTSQASHALWAAQKAHKLSASLENTTLLIVATASAQGLAEALRLLREYAVGPEASAKALTWLPALASRGAFARPTPSGGKTVGDLATLYLEFAEQGAPGPESLELLLRGLSSLPRGELAPALLNAFRQGDGQSRYWQALAAAPGRWLEVVRLADQVGKAALDIKVKAAQIGRASSPEAVLTELGALASADDTALTSLLPLVSSSPVKGPVLSRLDSDVRTRPLRVLTRLSLRGKVALWPVERIVQQFPVFTAADAADIAAAWSLGTAGEVDRARGHLEALSTRSASRSGKDATASRALAAIVRASWLSQVTRSPDAVEAWLAAVDLADAVSEDMTAGGAGRAAADTTRADTLALAVEALWPLHLADRLDRGPLEAVILQWLAAAPAPPQVTALDHSADRALLESLAIHPKFSARVRLALIERLGLLGSDTGLEERAALAARIESPDRDWLEDTLEAAAVARIELGQGGVDVERLAEDALKAQRSELAARLYSRLSPGELNRELVVDLVKFFMSRGEPERARRYAQALLARPEAAKAVASGRFVALGDALAEAGEWQLARESYQRAIDAGERTSRPHLGLIRTSLRLGDVIAADQAANQALSARPNRDPRTYDELAQVFLQEGHPTRAVELLKARVTQVERLDSNLFSALADLYKRAHRHDDLEALALEFAASDPRGTYRAHVVAAPRLMEIGRPLAALSLVEGALSTRPRDSSLLSAALNAALAASDPRAETYATRLLTEAPATWDLWVRILEDVRTSGQAEMALRLADAGLQRNPGQSRLLLARGRILLLTGRGDRALTDLGEALSRADDLRPVSSAIETELGRVWLDERLAAITGRALQLMPERADLTLSHAEALIAAGRSDEAERLLTRFLADADRGQAVVATTWANQGFSGRALQHWSRGFDQLGDADSVAALGPIANALSEVGDPGRAELFERLFLQALAGAKTPTLVPLGELHARLGAPDKALAWLERADIENPTRETARALFHHHLARLSPGDGGAAVLTHGERVVTRALSSAQPGRANPALILNELAEVGDLLLESGRPLLLTELATRIERRLGPHIGLKLMAARGLLRGGRLADALERLEGPFPAWRNAREALPHLGFLLEDLMALGHSEAAHGLMLRAVQTGQERELRLAALRVAARAGYPEQAAAGARQLAYELPSLNLWMTAEVLNAERMPSQAAVLAEAALAQGLAGAPRDRATRVLAAAGPGSTRPAGSAPEKTEAQRKNSPLNQALLASPRLSSDLWERSGVAARVGFSLSDSRGPERGARDLMSAHRAFLEALEAGPLDPPTVWAALATAGLLDEGEGRGEGASYTGSVLAALSPHQAQRLRTLEEAGRELSALGLAVAAHQVWSAARDMNPGYLPWAMEAAAAALAAGHAKDLPMVLARGFTGVESPPMMARLEVAALAASHGEGALGLELAVSQADPDLRQTRGVSERLARVKVLASLENNTALWDEAIAAYLAASPEESTARLEVARHVLATTEPGSPAISRARQLLEPLVAERRGSQHALELAWAGAMSESDLERASVLAAELAERYPVARLSGLAGRAASTLEPHLLLAFSLGTESKTMIDKVLARVASPVLPQVLSGLERLGPVAAAALEEHLVSERGWSLSDGGVDLEAAVLLSELRGDHRRALALTQSALALSPSSERAALLHARTLARAKDALPVSLAPAWDLIEKSAAGQRGRLGESEGRLLGPTIEPTIHLALAALHLAMGENAQAREAWRRFRVEAITRPTSFTPVRGPDRRVPFTPASEAFLRSPEGARYLSLGLELVERSVLKGASARGFLASCLNAARAPWSGRCRALFD